jgi:hypothetical protein
MCLNSVAWLLTLPTDLRCCCFCLCCCCWWWYYCFRDRLEEYAKRGNEPEDEVQVQLSSRVPRRVCASHQTCLSQETMRGQSASTSQESGSSSSLQQHNSNWCGKFTAAAVSMSCHCCSFTCPAWYCGAHTQLVRSHHKKIISGTAAAAAAASLLMPRVFDCEVKSSTV